DGDPARPEPERRDEVRDGRAGVERAGLVVHDDAHGRNGTIAAAEAADNGAPRTFALTRHRRRVYRAGMRALVSTAIVAAALLSLLPRPGAAACGDPGAVAAAGPRGAIDCNCTAATSHGQYVRCARMVALAIPVAPECVDDVVRCAARSTCGKPGAVACCRTDRTGRTRCSIKRSAD